MGVDFDGKHMSFKEHATILPYHFITSVPLCCRQPSLSHLAFFFSSCVLPHFLALIVVFPLKWAGMERDQRKKLLLAISSLNPYRSAQKPHFVV